MKKAKSIPTGGGAMFSASYATRHCEPAMLKKGVSVLVSPLPVKVSTNLQPPCCSLASCVVDSCIVDSASEGVVVCCVVACVAEGEADGSLCKVSTSGLVCSASTD